jgi:hypothetical protein
MYPAWYLLVCGLCYLYFVGIVYLGVLAVGCLVCLFPRPRSPSAFLRRVAKLGLFMAILLLVGDFFGFIWGGTIWGRFYESTDYCGTDFLPFLPVTQGIIDAPFGDQWHGLMGVSLFQLNLIWLLFALCTWGATLFLYRLLSRRCFG